MSVNGIVTARELYQFTKIILGAILQNGNGVADHRAFYPVTSKGHRYCGKVPEGISVIRYTRELVQRISVLRSISSQHLLTTGLKPKAKSPKQIQHCLLL